MGLLASNLACGGDENGSGSSSRSSSATTAGPGSTSSVGGGAVSSSSAGGSGGSVGSGGSGGEGGSGGTGTSCASIEASYEQLVGTTNQMCSDPNECQVLAGHCAIGLGGCWYTLNGSVSQAQLDALAAQWTGLGCMGPVCLCLPPPTSAVCEQGMCVPPP